MVPRTSQLVGRGLAAPSARTSPLLSAFGLKFRPFRPQESPPKDMGSVRAIKIAAKCSASLKRLNNTGPENPGKCT